MEALKHTSYQYPTRKDMRVISRLLESRKVGEDLDTKEEEAQNVQAKGKKGAKKEIKKKEAKK